MARRTTLVVILTTALALAGCGLDRGRSGGANPGADPTPPPVAADGEGFDFCGLIDLAATAETVTALGLFVIPPDTPLRLTGQRVTMGYGGGAEFCWYGTDVDDGALTLYAFPNGFPDDVERLDDTRYSERPELGPRAEFGASDSTYFLMVPAADAYLSLSVQRSRLVDDSLDEDLVERELAALLLPARDRVPAGARLLGLDAGAACADFEDAVTEALGAPPDHSRYTQVKAFDQVEADYACRFTASATGDDVAILVVYGTGESARQALPTSPWARAVPELDDTWLTDEGRLHVVRGEDVLQVLLMPDGRFDPDIPLDQRDVTREVALAGEVAALVFGDR